ncbi:HNH endonuclease [Runella limosa]|uniref:HNH endonuclease n=1 Tax=Runella limosa TaxID=370978 RepID=UPI000491D70E|nr:HNH endonuclease signature motif containing protein [Runella limosa]
MTFRLHTPKRRTITTVVNHYTDHKSDLQLDFKNRCGYCNDIHTWRVFSFEIDHFIPRKKDKKPFLTIKTDKDYSNLVYACKSCNNAKSNKWPTNDENIPYTNDEGFIDPCDINYNRQFTRLNNGQIRPITNLGKWMYNNLKLYKPQHEIIWKIEELEDLIDECENVLKTIDNDILKDKVLGLYREYREYTKQLGGI